MATRSSPLNQQTLTAGWLQFLTSAIVERVWPAWEAFAFKREVMRQRRQLAALSPEILRDIGITAAQARAEASRSVDDVPLTQRAQRRWSRIR